MFLAQPFFVKSAKQELHKVIILTIENDVEGEKIL